MSFPTNKKAGEAIATDDAFTVMGGSDGTASRALSVDTSGNLKGASVVGTIAAAVVSPAAPGATFGSSVTAVGYQSLSGFALIQGATGGTLDVFIQTSFDSGTTWVDCVHFTQLAAAAPQVAWAFAIRRGSSPAAPVSVNVASGTPSLAANTIAAGVLGNLVRWAFVAGAGTSAGAAQTIQVTVGQ